MKEPANDVLIVALPGDIPYISNVKMIEPATGRVITNYNKLTNTGKIDIGTLKTVTYVIRYYLNGQTVAHKFIKQ